MRSACCWRGFSKGRCAGGTTSGGMRSWARAFSARAAVQEHAPHKAKMLKSIGRRFELWRQRYERLSQELREQPYLLTPPQPPTIM